jgi:hypothetical protein
MDRDTITVLAALLTEKKNLKIIHKLEREQTKDIKYYRYGRIGYGQRL